MKTSVRYFIWCTRLDGHPLSAVCGRLVSPFWCTAFELPWSGIYILPHGSIWDVGATTPGSRMYFWQTHTVVGFGVARGYGDSTMKWHKPNRWIQFKKNNRLNTELGTNYLNFVFELIFYLLWHPGITYVVLVCLNQHQNKPIMMTTQGSDVDRPTLLLNRISVSNTWFTIMNMNAFQMYRPTLLRNTKISITKMTTVADIFYSVMYI